MLIELLSLVLISHAKEGKWAKKADMPTARRGLSTCAVNGKIYAIGGFGLNRKMLSTVEEYNPVTNTWKKKADMPTARACISASVVNGKIYVFGGRSSDTATRVEKYDPATDGWTEMADMLTARRWLSTSVVNGKIYAIGGCAEQEILATVEVYDTGFDVDAKGKLATSWGRLKEPEE